MATTTCSWRTASCLRQVWLKGPLRLYHIDHDRSAHASRPWTDRSAVSAHAELPNTQSWGLAEAMLSETTAFGSSSPLSHPSA